MTLCLSPEQETTDYGRPIVFVVEVGLQNPDEGPVLDLGWPTTFRSEVRRSVMFLQCCPARLLEGMTHTEALLSNTSAELFS